jgi:hypothetical protein
MPPVYSREESERNLTSPDGLGNEVKIMETQGKPQNQQKGNTVAKEFLFGLVAIGLGGYNLLNPYVWKFSFEFPQILGNALLILVGFILWLTAYKLWRHRYHTSRMF